MSIKFKSNVESEGKIIQSKHRAIKHTDTVQTLEVKVVTKTAAHPHHGTGTYGYTIDGVEGAYLELTPGITYRFDQSDGSNGGTGTGGNAHPLRFATAKDAAGSTAYTGSEVTTNGTPGSAGAYTQIIPTTTTPPILHYYCSSHNNMGSYAKFGTGTVGDTYSINASVNSSDSDDIDLNLDAASGTDSAVRLTAGSNISLTRNGAQQVTIASTASGGDTYDLNAVQDGNNVDINLTSGSGSDNSVVQLTAGTGITLTRNSAAEVTVASSASGSAGQVTTQINISGDGTTEATDGSRTQFTISSTPASENNLQIYIDGVYQSKNDFSVSGTTVTLDAAPATGAVLEIIHFLVVNANIFLQTHTTANNNTTSFNAGGTISSENDTQVYIDGVYQSKSNYSVSGSNVVLSTAPATGAVVEIVNIRATAGDNDSGSVEWQSTIKTSNFTAAASKGYFVNTTSGTVTVSLPAGNVGDEIHFTDYASTFDTNEIIFDPNGSEKIQGSTDNKICSAENATVRLIYQDATKGWTASNLSPQAVPYSVKYLVVAGGGASGGGIAYGNANGGGGGGAGGLRTNNTGDTSGGGNAASNETSVTFQPATSYTITVGAGGSSSGGVGDNGDDSSITGSDITDIVSTGGGGGGAEVSGQGNVSANAGGSGGGGPHQANTSGAGAGTTNQGYAGANGGTGSGGGGGGAGAAGSAGSGYSGGNGGVGVTTSIISSLKAGSESVGEVNNSNVYFAGGGGGGPYYNGSAGTGGLGGGGDGSNSGSNASQAGGTNTGGGGAGRNHHTSYGGAANGGAGGSGVVILRIPTASYSGTTVNLGHSYTDGSETILIFKQTGTIVG